VTRDPGSHDGSSCSVRSSECWRGVARLPLLGLVEQPGEPVERWWQCAVRLRACRVPRSGAKLLERAHAPGVKPARIPLEGFGQRPRNGLEPAHSQRVPDKAFGERGRWEGGERIQKSGIKERWNASSLCASAARLFAHRVERGCQRA